MKSVNERIRMLREKMAERQITAYLVPSDDFHASEYVGEYFQCRSFITGFTGSAGTALIMKDRAILWTDGRYFIQAEQQLRGSFVELFRMNEPGVPSLHDFLKENVKEGDCLGFDGRTVGEEEAEKLSEILTERSASLRGDLDLIGEIWEERPALSCEKAWILDCAYAGERAEEKIARVRACLAEKNADAFLLASLDDIAWLLNLRGNDVKCNPVVLSYLLLTGEKGYLYAQEEAFGEKERAYLEGLGFLLCPYNSIYEDLKSFKAARILLEKRKINSRLFACIPAGTEILDGENPTLLLKAVKNAAECENMKKAHVKDGVAVTRFIYWLKQHAGESGITELSAAEKLYSFREEQEGFLGNSFSPIIAAGHHGAIVHYSATEETDIPVERRGMVLSDTGGQYYEGTTDITRTIVTGELTAEEKEYFTAVLRGHLRLADAVFLKGCTGRNLDYLAREPLWRLGKDYNHGTGHGVGYLLNVHEGPNAFHWKRKEGVQEHPLEPGMITSDEPGYYEEGAFGIRHESLLLCKEVPGRENFLCFEEITMVPFDLDAVLPDKMEPHEKEILNTYHRTVYETISPYLDREEREWLKNACRSI